MSQTPRDTFFSVTCRKFNYLLSRLGPLITNIRPGLLATLLNNVASRVAHKTMLNSTIETSLTLLEETDNGFVWFQKRFADILSVCLFHILQSLTDFEVVFGTTVAAAPPAQQKWRQSTWELRLGSGPLWSWRWWNGRILIQHEEELLTL